MGNVNLVKHINSGQVIEIGDFDLKTFLAPVGEWTLVSSRPQQTPVPAGPTTEAVRIPDTSQPNTAGSPSGPATVTRPQGISPVVWLALLGVAWWLWG